MGHAAFQCHTDTVFGGFDLELTQLSLVLGKATGDSKVSDKNKKMRLVRKNNNTTRPRPPPQAGGGQAGNGSRSR